MAWSKKKKQDKELVQPIQNKKAVEAPAIEAPAIEAPAIEAPVIEVPTKGTNKEVQKALLLNYSKVTLKRRGLL